MFLFFSTGAAAIRKDWQLAGVNMPIVNSVAFKEELHYMLQAVRVPGMARMKLTLLTHKYFLLLGHIPSPLDSLKYFIFFSQFCGLRVNLQRPLKADHLANFQKNGT